MKSIFSLIIVVLLTCSISAQDNIAQNESANKNIFTVNNLVATHKEASPIYKRQTYHVINADNTPNLDSINNERNNKRSYFGIVSLGLMSGPMIDGSAKSIFSIKTIHGLQENDYLAIGVGFGVERYPNITMIPTFFDIRTYFLSGDVGPLIFLDVGYSSTADKKGDIQSGGMMLHLGTGLRVSIYNTISIVVDIGYKNQKTEVISPYTTSNLTYDLFTTSIGVAF
ncbi:MAG: hypothetical protein HY960_09620 [Ignavibacteriae bacterium]|nr:hypothetical protein [Ignavibacteriota bacterium]